MAVHGAHFASAEVRAMTLGPMVPVDHHPIKSMPIRASVITMNTMMMPMHAVMPVKQARMDCLDRASMPRFEFDPVEDDGVPAAACAGSSQPSTAGPLKREWGEVSARTACGGGGALGSLIPGCSGAVAGALNHRPAMAHALAGGLALPTPMQALGGSSTLGAAVGGMPPGLHAAMAMAGVMPATVNPAMGAATAIKRAADGVSATSMLAMSMPSATSMLHACSPTVSAAMKLPSVMSNSISIATHGIMPKAERQQHGEAAKSKKKRSRLGEQRLPGIWGPFWRYDQCSHDTGKEQHLGLQEPVIPNWPEGIRRTTGKKIFWLPEGWGQGVKKTAGGKTLKVYVDTQGRVFYHKADVESAYKVKLPDKDPRLKSGPLDLQTARPSWPPGDWLPRDWFVCYKKLQNRLVKCFVTPDQSGFAYHKFSVIDYLNGKGKLTSVDRRILRITDGRGALVGVEKQLIFSQA